MFISLPSYRTVLYRAADNDGVLDNSRKLFFLFSIKIHTNAGFKFSVLRIRTSNRDDLGIISLILA